MYKICIVMILITQQTMWLMINIDGNVYLILINNSSSVAINVCMDKHYTFVYRTVFVNKIMECLWRTVVIIKPNVLQTKLLQINSNRVDFNPCMVWISFGVYLLVEFGVFKDIPFHAWSHCIYIQNTYK